MFKAFPRLNFKGMRGGIGVCRGGGSEVLEMNIKGGRGSQVKMGSMGNMNH